LIVTGTFIFNQAGPITLLQISARFDVFGGKREKGKAIF
jgi:hypothetical protein